MAKPIQLDFPARDCAAELRQRLDAATTEHAAAILEFLELLETLHRHNVLSTVRGLAGAGDDLIGRLSRAAAQPESIRALRNMLALAKIVGQINPALIEALGRLTPPEFKDSSVRARTPAPGIWKTVKVLSSPPARRVFFAMGLVLVGIGYYMNKETAWIIGRR